MTPQPTFDELIAEANRLGDARVTSGIQTTAHGTAR